MAFSGVCVGRIKDGRLVEAWNHFDFLGLYQQLGVVPVSFT
jgi:predicted ester cyclase